MTGLILFAHGSTVDHANDSVRQVAAAVAARSGYEAVETAFLDCAPPDLRTSVGVLVSRGADRIVVIPYFLTLGIHMRRDLPGIVEELQRIHSGVSIEVAAPLDGHPALIDIVCERAEEALHGGSRSEGSAD
jgi:sirohydrochlorin ferrochelatase